MNSNEILFSSQKYTNTCHIFVIVGLRLFKVTSLLSSVSLKRPATTQKSVMQILASPSGARWAVSELGVGSELVGRAGNGGIFDSTGASKRRNP